MNNLIVSLYKCTWWYHGLHINTSGRYSPVSAISPRQKGISPPFSPWQGRNTFLPGRKPTLLALIISFDSTLQTGGGNDEQNDPRQHDISSWTGIDIWSKKLPWQSNLIVWKETLKYHKPIYTRNDLDHDVIDFRKKTNWVLAILCSYLNINYYYYCIPNSV